MSMYGPAPGRRERPSFRMANIVGRLKPGVRKEQAQAELNAIA
jgi:hypothetical protein